MQRMIKALKRVSYDLIVLGSIITLFMFRIHELFPAPIQTIMMKGTLISCGFLHAHITRKLCFGSVDWESCEQSDKKLLVIVLYVIFIYAWAQGG